MSAPTTTIVSAISGSMKRADGDRMSSAASESVMLWPIVNDVTISASRDSVPPSSSSPIRNRMWSGPIRMCSMPDSTNVFTTAQRPCVLPE